MSVVIFCASDVPGVVSACCSYRYYAAQKKEVSIVSGADLTGTPKVFWLSTFLNYDFNGVEEILITFLPFLPEKKNEKEKVSKRISALRKSGVEKLTVIDIHRFIFVDYKTLRDAGATVVVDTGFLTAFMGEPDEYTVKYCRLSMILAREKAVQPCTEEEEALADQLRFSLANDHQATRDRIRTDCLDGSNAIPNYGQSKVDFRGKVRSVLHLETGHPLGSLFWYETNFPSEKNTLYTVGIEPLASGQFAVWVLTDWQRNAIPASILLDSKMKVGHDNAFLFDIFNKERKAQSAVNQIIQLLNQENKLKTSRKRKRRFANLAVLIAWMFSKIDIPPWLTQHGWWHVQRVYSHVYTISSLFSLTEEQERLLFFAVIFHDLGYMVNQALGKDYPDTEVRKNHHLYSVEIIEAWEDQGMFEGLLSLDELEKVKLICERHRKKTGLTENPELDHLILLFRLCDALDTTYQRAIFNDRGQHYTELLETEFDMDRDPEHWDGHRAVLGVKMTSELLEGEVPSYTFQFIVTDFRLGGFKIEDLRAESFLLKKALEEDGIPLEVEHTVVESKVDWQGVAFA